MFSTVTAAICIRRMPHLSIELRTVSYVTKGPTNIQAGLCVILIINSVQWENVFLNFVEFLVIMGDFPAIKMKTMNYHAAEDEDF